MQNSAANGLDPFAEERKEYERTVGDLFNELAEWKRYSKVAMEELLNKLAESEQDRTASAERMLRAEEERRSAEEDLRARIQRDYRMDSTSSDLRDPFSKEREDYLKTIEELYDRVLSLEQRKTESMNEKWEAEERQPIAECDYLAQIQKAREFEELYNAEKRKRESIEEELARCKEEAKKAIGEHDDKVTEEEAKKPIGEHDDKVTEGGGRLVRLGNLRIDQNVVCTFALMILLISAVCCCSKLEV